MTASRAGKRVTVSRKPALAEGETARTACARGLLRTGVDEKTGELLPATLLARRVGWAVDLVSGLTATLLAEHWNTTDVDILASGQDAGGRTLPSNAWMALRRLGWTVTTPDGVRVNDRIVRIAQEQAGRVLRSAKWRADLTAGVLATWPADPGKRTAGEWDAVRAAVPGGQHMPSSVITSRTRQITAFAKKHGRMPVDVFEAEAVPRIARMLLLSACDGQPSTAPSASPRCGTAKPPTGPPRQGGNGPSARPAGGRATATTARGSASPHAASPTRPRRSPTVPAAPW